ncbi:MAG: ribosome maturation factor RimP [Clostridia bacterium]|nr:ribosome maturation factor RimP [Clostridia bacterium]MBR6565112.1 ribosome maturation factor RimP [Clostridia bacterium]
MASAAERVYALIKETVESQGVELWDVRFLKEGASWYLRVFIDKEEGITIDDCTNVSHAIDPVIDEADPIDKSYYLEVCSPGIERELIRPEHFEKMIGQIVKLKLYKAIDGVKEFKGELLSFDGKVKLMVDSTSLEFDLKEISKANLCDFE